MRRTGRRPSRGRQASAEGVTRGSGPRRGWTRCADLWRGRIRELRGCAVVHDREHREHRGERRRQRRRRGQECKLGADAALAVDMFVASMAVTAFGRARLRRRGGVVGRRVAAEGSDRQARARCAGAAAGSVRVRGPEVRVLRHATARQHRRDDHEGHHEAGEAVGEGTAHEAETGAEAAQGRNPTTRKQQPFAEVSPSVALGRTRWAKFGRWAAGGRRRGRRRARRRGTRGSSRSSRDRAGA